MAHDSDSDGFRYTLAASSPVMGNCRIEGYRPPDPASAYDGGGTVDSPCRDRAEAETRLAEGGIFLDRDGIDLDTFSRGVIAGPMSTPIPGGSRPFEPGRTAETLLGPGGFSGEFRTLLGLAVAQQRTGRPGPGALDQLDPAEYAAWWAARGAVVWIKREGRLVRAEEVSP